MPDFHNPAAFLLLLFIPALYFLRRAGFLTRIAFVLTVSDWNGKSFDWKRKPRNFASWLSRVCAVLAFGFAGLCAGYRDEMRQEIARDFAVVFGAVNGL